MGHQPPVRRTWASIISTMASHSVRACCVYSRVSENTDVRLALKPG